VLSVAVLVVFPVPVPEGVMASQVFVQAGSGVFQVFVQAVLQVLVLFDQVVQKEVLA
jgi:hypothetical protein